MAEIIIFYCVKLLHKHDKLTQCCRMFTLALAKLSCSIYHVHVSNGVRSGCTDIGELFVIFSSSDNKYDD